MSEDDLSVRDNHPLRSKRIVLDGRRYIEVPLAVPPSSVPGHAWDRLSAINDYILDRVAYDTARAASPTPEGVQAPVETLRRGRGICMDFAALFEHLARKERFVVRSVRSAELNHAWNTVQIGDRWWIVDVTWNSGARTEAGSVLPSSATNDPDFRKRYLLTTVQRERELVKRGLLTSTHDAPDGTDIDFARTLEATSLAERVDALLARRASVIAAHAEATREHAELLAESRAAEDQLSDPAATARRALNIAKRRVIRDRLAVAAARTDQLAAEAEDLAATAETLVGQISNLSSAYPLGIRFEYVHARRSV